MDASATGAASSDATADASNEANDLLHATCVALDAKSGLLILGPSGSGKSALALALMACGAHLVADDRTRIHRAAGADVVEARCPEAIAGRIEARGVGILAADPLASCVLRGVVDLSQIEEERLPPLRETRLLGVSIPLFHKVDAPHFAPALLQWLKGTRCA
ncbi:HPr kinase/phosphorylase [Celeribacter sp.]|uniref:HPr kinase/phosphorylase n=1 Tax=Celeribacter sp. TaxID=1890673 RepID=UPI003A940E9A